MKRVGPFGIGLIEGGSGCRTILGLHFSIHPLSIHPLSIHPLSIHPRKAENLAVGEGQVRTGIVILGAGVLGLAGLLSYGAEELPERALSRQSRKFRFSAK
jgi:hypothetical protein